MCVQNGRKRGVDKEKQLREREGGREFKHAEKYIII
jgi:hypothetical protein